MNQDSEDAKRELRITIANANLILADSPLLRQQALAEMTYEINSRSPEQVARMEQSRGLV